MKSKPMETRARHGRGRPAQANDGARAAQEAMLKEGKNGSFTEEM